MPVRGTYSNSSPTRHDLYFHNSKLKTAHQAPMDSPQSKPASSANTVTAADASSASHSDITAGLRPANGAAASSDSSVEQPSQLMSCTKGWPPADWVIAQRDRSINRVDRGMQQVSSNAEPVLTATQDSSHSSIHSNGNIRDPSGAQAASVHATHERPTAAPSSVLSVRQPQTPRESQPRAASHESYAPRPAQHGDMLLEIVLSDEVKDFLAQPVSGPCRPIIFDLETTGTAFPLECSPCKHHTATPSVWVFRLLCLALACGSTGQLDIPCSCQAAMYDVMLRYCPGLCLAFGYLPFWTSPAQVKLLCCWSPGTN